MKPETLRTVFDRVLRLAAGPSLALGASCGPGLPADPASYSLPACVDGFLALDGIKAAAAFDYAELRQIFNPGQGSTERALGHTGTVCATATDKATCRAALDSLKSMTGFSQQCVDACVAYYLATTRADEVKAVNTVADWRAFLGPVDSIQEAALVAWSSLYSVSCTDKARGGVREVPGGYEVIATKGIGCGPGNDVVRYVLQVAADGTVRESSSAVIEPGNPNCAIGRRPAGLRAARRGRSHTALGRYFASAAHLEAASVDAFRLLEAELLVHGAPAALLGQARIGALDEVRHARVTARLARRFGACPQRPVVAWRSPRPLEAVALENAVEGCVRETFGALVARLQAARAADPAIAAVMAGIAEDEGRHAALAWQVGAWAERRLGRAARAPLRAARRRAIDVLRAELGAAPAPDLVTQAGLPTAAEAQALTDELARELWDRA